LIGFHPASLLGREMKQAEVRFYAELNNFLTPWRRRRTTSYTFELSGAVKDMIEGLGVPHRPEENLGETFSRTARSSPKAKLFMSVLVSLVSLAVGFYTILSGAYEMEAQKWAYASCGTIIGFWLHRE
jgi:Mut7-C ubiquitin